MNQPGMLTIVVKTIVTTNNYTLAKSTANTNTNTFTVFTFGNVHFFPRSSIKKVNKITAVNKMAKSLQFTVT